MNVSTKQQRIAELARSDPARAFVSLNAQLDLDWLREAYDRTRKSGAVGVDGQTAQQYAADLEANLADLLDRMKSGRYRAPPVRRVKIPKAGSRTETRPLGIPTFEDKVAQRAIVMLLEPIYEQDFLPCSYGFRPGRSAHHALRELREGLMTKGQRWVLDVDVSKYFDTIDHGHLRRFLDRRVVDGVVRRLIDKWLAAGVLDGEQLSRSPEGTPQGGVISPLIANVYLHYVLDEWFHESVVPLMKERVTLVRYADDFVLGFEDFLDSQRVLRVLGKRFGRFGLALHPTKTRLVDFRFRRPQGVHPKATGTSFDFLGFTHVWGKSQRGKPVIFQHTAKDRYRRTLRAFSVFCRRVRHDPLPEQHAALSRRLLGHYAYFGITGNARRIRWLHHEVERIWMKWLTRRTRGLGRTWDRLARVRRDFALPQPRIVHRYTTSTSEAAS